MLVTCLVAVLRIKIRQQGISVYIAFVPVAHLIENIKCACSFALGDDMKSRLAVKLYRAVLYMDIASAAVKMPYFIL